MDLVLLASLPESGWNEIRQQLGDVILEPEQQAFGGTPSDFVDLERDPARHVFLIYVEETLTGVGSLMTGPISAAIWPLQTPAIQLRGFVIDPKMQGRGIGTMATKEVIRLAKTIDPSATHLTLTVNQRNPGARRTYEKVGFQTLPEPYLGGPAGPQDIMFIELE